MHNKRFVQWALQICEGLLGSKLEQNGKKKLHFVLLCPPLPPLSLLLVTTQAPTGVELTISPSTLLLQTLRG